MKNLYYYALFIMLTAVGYSEVANASQYGKNDLDAAIVAPALVGLRGLRAVLEERLKMFGSVKIDTAAINKIVKIVQQELNALPTKGIAAPEPGEQTALQTRAYELALPLLARLDEVNNLIAKVNSNAGSDSKQIAPLQFSTRYSKPEYGMSALSESFANDTRAVLARAKDILLRKIEQVTGKEYKTSYKTFANAVTIFVNEYGK